MRKTYKQENLSSKLASYIINYYKIDWEGSLRNSVESHAEECIYVGQYVKI